MFESAINIIAGQVTIMDFIILGSLAQKCPIIGDKKNTNIPIIRHQIKLKIATTFIVRIMFL